MSEHNKVRGKSKRTTSGLEGKSKNNSQCKPELMLFSLRDFDDTQGQSFEDWSQYRLLHQMMNTLRGYCTMNISEALGKNFKIYGDFPKAVKTDFKKPSHVTDDARWASLHIQGKECIAGHVIRNIFYIVFLDKKHRFCISELKHT